MDKYMNFTHKTLKWYAKNQRSLPWRRKKPEPYHIWLSEIIMQQTRISQGTSYYLKFISAYPDIEKLAFAEEDEILKNWQGLGYYSRARNMHSTAKTIVEKHSGKFPDSYEELKKLKGIGEYTASAIASIAFNIPKAVVDGNVYRVLSRYFGITDPIDSTGGKKKFQKMANLLLDINNPADYNQAVMEFGALQCVPRRPDCPSCPLRSNCFAFNENQTHLLPFKSKKTKQRTRFFNYLVVEQENLIFLRKRRAKDIWENLYDFPLIESEKLWGEEEVASEIGKSGIFTMPIHISAFKISAPHLLSHQKIRASFSRLSIKNENKIDLPDVFPVQKDELKKYAVPKLLENYILNESDLLHLL